MDNHTPAMTPKDTLMEQCRREAEERYPTQEKRLRDCGYDEDAVWSACTEQAARRGAYAAALFHERSKPRTSLSVDEVMDIVAKWDIEASEEAHVEPATNYGLGELRARLTAKRNELNTQTNG